MPDSIESGEFFCTPAAFKINKTAGNEGARIVLDVPETHQDKAYILGRMRKTLIEVTWRVINDDVIGQKPTGDSNV